jgi:LexA-binding, inner membrane-associated putative hydrolase
MRARLSPGRLAERLGDDLSPLQVLACAAILYFADWAFLHSGGSYFPGGLFDEAAHFVTALLLLQGLPSKYRAKIILPALIASVAVDLDHIPEYLGYGFFSEGTPRPYAHSLLTLVVLLSLALALRHHRKLLVGLALGVALHFFRDLAEGNGAGVSLLWPLSTHSFSYPHGTFLTLMACVVAADLGLAILNQKTRVATP